jgi:Skp family chaperone for outer membrane proteins
MSRFEKLGVAGFAALAGLILIVSSVAAHQTHASVHAGLASFNEIASSARMGNDVEEDAAADAAAMAAELQKEAAEKAAAAAAAQQAAAAEAAKDATETQETGDNETETETETGDNNTSDETSAAANTEHHDAAKTESKGQGGD